MIITKDITPKISELFLSNGTENCMVISSNSVDGSLVNYPNGEQATFTENYWRINDFYKLWFE